MSIILSNLNQFTFFFTGRIRSKFAVKRILNIPPHLANTLLKDEKSARDNLVFACNFAKYSPIFIFFTHRRSNKPYLIWLLQPYHTLNMQLHYLVICRQWVVLLTLTFHKVL